MRIEKNTGAPFLENSLILGFIAIGLYCLFISISSVWVTFSFANISGLALTFVTLFIAQVVFISASVIKKESPFQFWRKNKRPVFILNVLTLMSWLLMFMALQRLEASVESAIFQGWVPIAVLLCEWREKRTRIKSLRAVGPLMTAIFLSLLVVARMVLQGVVNTNSHQLYEGIVLAILAGVTGGMYVYFSAKMHLSSNASVLSILSTRFIVLLIVTGCLGYDQLVILYHHRFDTVLRLILLSVVFVIVPIYCLQYAVASLGAARVSIITPLVPAIALGAEYYIAPWQNAVIPFLVVMVCLSLIISNSWLKKT